MSYAFENPAEVLDSTKGSPEDSGKSLVRPASHHQFEMPEDGMEYIDEGWSGDGGVYAPPGGWAPCDCGLWVDAEFLVWWRRGRDLPPLVTSAPNGTPLATAGVLGQATTTVLFGGEHEGGHARPGGRITIGAWLDDCQTLGVMGRFFGSGNETVRFAVNSSAAGVPIIAIPFFDAALNQENSLVVAFPTAPDQRVGSVTISSTSEVLGAEALLRRRFYEDPLLRLDLIAGYQSTRINEDLIINSSTTVGNQFRQDPQDLFRTTNEFHGAVVGIYGDYDRGCWRMTGVAKVGLGNTAQELTIAGQNSVQAPPGAAPVVQNAGLFAQASNIGVYTQDEFAAVPELGWNLSWYLNDRIDLSLGYSFIYWSAVLLPASELHRRIDDQPGATVPAVQLDSQNFWMHGINLGGTWRF